MNNSNTIKLGRTRNNFRTPHVQRLTEMAKKLSSEAFYALVDPPEAAVYSVLVEMLKEINRADRKNGENEIELTSPPQS